VAGTATAIAVAVGLPLAWLLGRHSFWGKSLLQAPLILPAVLPATLLGYWAVALSRSGPLAATLQRIGFVPSFGWKMAVATAGLGALAVFVRFAQADFARVDQALEQAARALGRSEWSLFWSVTLPLAWRGVAAGVALAFCRALAEFALTLLVAGALPPSPAASALGLFAVLASAVLVLMASRLTHAVG
jgi:molybdate transport system permease protein